MSAEQKPEPTASHPDQTSPMTVGPEAYMDEAVREDAGLIEIATALELSVEWLEIDPVAEERGVVDYVRDALNLARALPPSAASSQERIAQLEARVAEAEKVIAPFAHPLWSDEDFGGMNDTDKRWSRFSEDGNADLTLGDFRAARAFLALGAQPLAPEGECTDIAAERERIASALDYEASITPCAEDAIVVAGCSRLVRANFSYDEAERLASEADDTEAVPGWIDWAGGECPVADDVRVEYRMLDGHTDVDPRLASSLRWTRLGWGGDIIAYRIVGAAK